MLVLAIDTSTPQLTVGAVEVLEPHEIIAALEVAGRASGDGALRRGDTDRLLAERSVVDAFGHAERLMPMIRATLVEAQRTLKDLTAIVVGIGPGPFTGLRVGMATAASLGDALGVAVHGVPSHDAMAAAAAAHGGDFLVVTDARRKEAYVSGYTASAGRAFGPAVVAPDRLSARLADAGFAPHWLTGAGASLVADKLQLPVHPAGGSLARALVECVHRPLVTGAVPGPLSPLYLRRPDAAEPAGPKPVLPAV